MAPPLNGLASLLRSNSPDHNAKGTQSAVTEANPGPASYRLYACRFRICFTPRTGVLFTFPSRYCFTIGRQGVFSLGRWSCRIHTGFLVPRTTRDSLRRVHTFDYRTITFYGKPFQASSSNVHLCNSTWSVPQPLKASS